MLNFNCLNKALLDENLDHIEFRMLYLIANSIGLNDKDEIIMYNAYLAEKLHITEREVQKLTSSLVKKGYISKTPIRIGNKKPNKIKLSVKPDTDFSKVNEQSFVEIDESQRTAVPKVNEQPFTPYNSTEDNITCTCTEMKEETTKRLTRDEVAKRNDFITSVYKKLDDDLDYLFTVKTKITYDGMCEKINRIFQEANDNDEWFTDAQWAKLQRYADRFIKICDGKDNYFSNAPTPGPVTYDENAECSVDELWE